MGPDTLRAAAKKRLVGPQSRRWVLKTAGSLQTRRKVLSGSYRSTSSLFGKNEIREVSVQYGHGVTWTVSGQDSIFFTEPRAFKGYETS